MTKKELFKRYSINESHNVWDFNIDNWISVEIYRIMHNGELPKNDMSIKWVCNFIDIQREDKSRWFGEIMTRKDFGSLYLTAKRMIYRHYKDILKEL